MNVRIGDEESTTTDIDLNSHEMSSPRTLIDALLDQLDPTSARAISTRLDEQGLTSTAQELVEELRDASSKVCGEAIRAMPELQRRCGLGAIISWLDFGIILTQATGAVGLRYFKESPWILGVMEDDEARAALLHAALELADRPMKVAPNCAFALFKKGPELLLEIPVDDLASWADVGMDLAQEDFVLGGEFFRESPSIAHAIPRAHLRAWIEFGMRLVTTNTLGKPDYVGTLEFFRTSPGLLAECGGDEVKQWVIDVGAAVAAQSPEAAIAFLAACPQRLNAMPSHEWRVRVLKYALLLADRDVVAVAHYLERASEMLQLIGASEESTTVFEQWFRGGMDVLDYSVEGGCAYFALETRSALTAIEQAMQGVPLRRIVRSLKLFAQGMCGSHVSIEPLPSSDERTGDGGATGSITRRANTSADGATIYLPPLMREGTSREGNMRLYTVMTAHEAGHLEFGTYRIGSEVLEAAALAAAARYGGDTRSGSTPPVRTLAHVFEQYPQRGVIQDLWEVLEDARVEFLLQQEYPGLRDDLQILTKQAVDTRSFLHGMTVREMVLDALLLRFADEPSGHGEQEDLRDVVEQAWSVARTILRSDATASDAVRLADRIYQLLDDLVANLSRTHSPEPQSESASGDEDHGAGPRAAEEVAGDYRPITNWAFRGRMDPDRVQGDGEADDENDETSSSSADDHKVGASPGGVGPSAHTSDRPADHLNRTHQESGDPIQRFGHAPLEEWLHADRTAQRVPSALPEARTHWVYDEWDGTIQDYRPRWCHVHEEVGTEGAAEFVDHTLLAYGAELRVLRRYFETLRPTGLRRLGRQDRGDELDVDAVVERVADARVGHEPSDRVYLRRERHERQVAAAFLIDISGSTGRQIGRGTRRVIDVEKEGLLLLCEALGALGDPFALYGYSGKGRGHVDIVVMKDFDEPAHHRTGLRISALEPRHQNRDGAAIRHAVARLLEQPARTRLLVLISDGRPLDDGYGDEYALEDTRAALREARANRVHPFCITVDQEAGSYLKRMYGEVGFVVIDDVSTLPMRLPAIYQRLTA